MRVFAGANQNITYNFLFIGILALLLTLALFSRNTPDLDGHDMNSTTPSKSSSLRDRLALFIRLEVKALLISFLLIAAIIISLLCIFEIFTPDTGRYVEGEYEFNYYDRVDRFVLMFGSIFMAVGLFPALSAFVHIYTFRKYFITYYDEAQNCSDIALNDERITMYGDGFKVFFSIYTVIITAMCVIFAPSCGGVLPTITGIIVNEIWHGMIWGEYVGGLSLAIIALILMLNCRANKFSDVVLRRIRIFMIIMIINYSIGLSVEFIDNMYSAFRMRTTIILLGIIVFSSVIYLKSQKLSELKRAQSSEGLSARKKLDELGCGFLLIGAIFLLWALLMIFRRLWVVALIIAAYVIVKIFKGLSEKIADDKG